MGNTDTRWYWDLSEQIFRFSPVQVTMEETKMFHGLNEKISIDGLTWIIDFYKTLVMQVEDDQETYSSKNHSEMNLILS